MVTQNKERLVKDREEGMAKVRKGGYAFFLESQAVEYEVAQDCNLEQVGGLVTTVYYAIGMRKGRNLSKTHLKILFCLQALPSEPKSTKPS